jgi:hypothetical protein
MKISLFNIVYRRVSPFLGNRAAVAIGELAPALLFAGIPLLLFLLVLSGPADHPDLWFSASIVAARERLKYEESKDC